MSVIHIIRACLPGALFVLLGLLALGAARRGERLAPLPGQFLHRFAGPLLIAGGIVLIVLDLLHFE